MAKQNTYIPGMGIPNEGNNLYSRPNGLGGIAGGNETIVPGFTNAAAAGMAPSNQPTSHDVPIVGFLYSISHNGIPEYWPLHIGSNLIGRSADCDVQLNEMSVSNQHATINIKQMKTTGKYIASIRDVGSKSGLFLNDQELDYDNHTCKHEDVITVGENYQLLLLLIDAGNYNLKPSENFRECEPDLPSGLYNPQQRIEDGTIDLSGANYGNEAGETKFM